MCLGFGMVSQSLETVLVFLSLSPSSLAKQAFNPSFL